MQVEDIPRQIVLTKDNVSVEIDSVMYWDIQDPFTATFLVSDVRRALMERTQTTLRMVMGNRTLQDSIEHREAVAAEISTVIEAAAASWGVKVEAILLKDIILGQDLLANMSCN
jgi:regulator of protease activity HflC (stomatin/prohibitin superfamily)